MNAYDFNATALDGQPVDLSAREFALALDASVEAVVERCAAEGVNAGSPLGRGYPEYADGLLVERIHAAHHAVDRHFGNANFSTILSLWDRLFRSYARPADGGATTRAPDARKTGTIFRYR